jgi:hypothetical protein
MDADIHAAGRDLVKMRFPEMRALLFDEFDSDLARLAEPVAKARRQFEAAGATADNHDPVWPGSLT